VGVFVYSLGGVEKWLSRQAHNLKNVGSNPTPTNVLLLYVKLCVCGGCSLTVKCWLVAPRDMGSIPIIPV
jgi:hypothetical protein